MLNKNAFLGMVTNGQNEPLRHAVSSKDGPLNVTGVKTDLAIRGNGWFVVETESGPLLTRDGRFRINEEGALIDRRGLPLLAENGSISGLHEQFSVMADGSINIENRAVAKLRIVSVSDSAQLKTKGDGLYEYSGDLVPATGAAVLQGAYESSNVDTAADMMQLMRTTRHIETMQRSMSAYDQILNTGINQLGK